jgi:hypothetical protein
MDNTRAMDQQTVEWKTQPHTEYKSAAQSWFSLSMICYNQCTSGTPLPLNMFVTASWHWNAFGIKKKTVYSTTQDQRHMPSQRQDYPCLLRIIQSSIQLGLDDTLIKEAHHIHCRRKLTCKQVIPPERLTSTYHWNSKTNKIASISPNITHIASPEQKESHIQHHNACLS